MLEQTQGIHSRDKFRLNRFILSHSGGKTPKFYYFLDFGICGVTNWQRTKEAEHGCTRTNVPLCNSIKTVIIV